MEGRLLLKDCSVFRSDGRVRSGVAVLFEEQRIAAVEENDALAVRPGDWEVSCRGRLVGPGRICPNSASDVGGVVCVAGVVELDDAVDGAHGVAVTYHDEEPRPTGRPRKRASLRRKVVVRKAVMRPAGRGLRSIEGCRAP